MGNNKPKRPRSPTLGREEPFPCWEWYGLGLFADLPEADREPFRKWLLKRNDSLPEAERWPFRQLRLPEGFERHEDIFSLSDHTRWVLKAAFERSRVR